MKFEDKKPFTFKYFKPCLDWYEVINVEIKPTDYYYFHLERRFGPSWWVIGCNLVKEPKYEWVNKELGEISPSELVDFIKWCETENGSRITQINVISGSFNIFNEIKKLLK